MKEEYIVYLDRSKQLISVIINGILILICIGFLCMKTIPVGIRIFLGVIILLMGIMEGGNIRNMKEKRVLYRLDPEGITDYTEEKEPVYLEWSHVIKVDTVVNHTSLQIGIMGIEVLDDQKEIGERIRRNLSVNGNIACYHIVIDGFQFRKKVFAEIQDQCRQFARKYHPEVVITESKDPFLKR